MDTTHIVGLSGGKDSTALALRLREVEPRDYTYLITPTGDELPEMLAHWERLEELLGKPLTRVTNGTLNELIHLQNALPNWRQRWCTRILKIEPTIEFIKEHAPALLYVGLRADEEEREGIYDERVTCRFPLREWGWGIQEVQAYLRERNISIPTRTDCARCFGQRLYEWRELWENYPQIYADAEAQERQFGHTFRSPKRDTWPASLKELREAFERGDRKLPSRKTEEFFGCEKQAPCRVCRF